ncbi:uncharacterized protein LOC122074684 isoform X3 [Macadamia integrifolia]|uniref:uncharacterized protein LOC122074684 isoform X3 n=1 Tax=Macadamia integrifolia TaxID=60698 RepID=UPI001C4FFB7D|nr:uncharacterized protein LOC122074684 isoform X3 [Macadamia integrifolia]
MESTLSVDLSTGTGYLQDAIVAWNNRCKRRRISPFCHDNIDEFSKNCWNSMDYEDPFVKFESLRENYSPVAERNPLQNWLNSTDKRWTAPLEKMPGEHEYQINQLFASSFSHMDSTTMDPQEEKDPSRKIVV